MSNKIQELINQTYEKAVKAHDEIMNIVKLSNEVSVQESIAKNAVSEQASDNRIILDALKDMKATTQKVGSSIEELHTTFESIKVYIGNMDVEK